MRVSVVIPTHNEAQAIARVLADVPADVVTEVLVVDSNSTDGTPEIAERMGARVLREPRRGYGRACLTGLAAVNDPDVVVFLDGDYSDRPNELPLLLTPIAEGRADITLGSRLAKQNVTGALPWHSVFGNQLAAFMMRVLYGQRLTDLGPFRAARADVLRQLALEEMTYGWAVEMILKGALGGFRIVEVPVSYYPRIGKSKISGTLRGTFGAAWFILSRIVLYRFRRERNGVSSHRLWVMESNEIPHYSDPGNCTLVIMAKAPRAGMVKTRLAHSIPVEAVTELYRCLLNDTIALAHSLSGVKIAIMCPASDVTALSEIAGGTPVVPQQGDGLAAGLTTVFAHFTAHGSQRVVAFNSDSPHLPPSVLTSAFEMLSNHDVVVGPTHDGGYYLVGAKTRHDSLFHVDGMGTASALDALLERARKLQLSVSSTEPFYDVDVEHDLNRLAAELHLHPARAPRTAAWLKQWQHGASQLRSGATNL